MPAFIQNDMDNAKYNEWAYYPINLTPQEAKEPLLVLNDFFDLDLLPGQLEELKQWRNLVIADKYYKGPKESPAGLLFFHKLNVCLVEAMYLIKDLPGNRYVQNAVLLAKEKTDWVAFPNDLSEAELLNPTIVINNFFLAYTLPEYREQLYAWLEYGLSANAANEFIETSDLVNVYENLRKLYQAAWLIHQRSTLKPYLKAIPLQSPADTLVQSDAALPLQDNADNHVSLYRLNKAIDSGNQELISRVIAVIKQKVSSVQAVIYLGTNPVKPDQLFLLVLVAGEEKRQASELSNTIEDNCRQIADVTALVHHVFTMQNAVKENNPFFRSALKCPLVYLSGGFFLPEGTINTSYSLQSTQALWERWHEQGKDFFLGAEWHLTSGAFKPALFLIHQAVECMLIAIIRAVTGYRVNVHNLFRLLTITGMFTNDLYNVLGLEDEENKKLFKVLQHAYINVRYKDTFEVDSQTVYRLFLLAKKLIAVTENTYERYLLTNNL